MRHRHRRRQDGDGLAQEKLRVRATRITSPASDASFVMPELLTLTVIMISNRRFPETFFLHSGNHVAFRCIIPKPHDTMLHSE